MSAVQSPLLQEFQARGLIHAHTPALDAHLHQGPVRAYLGIDPTGGSLHIGHLAGITAMARLQAFGHQPIFLIGGATAMIGDPSGRSSERNLLAEADIQQNAQAIGRQLERFADFSGENGARMVNNADWFRDKGFLDVLRDIGKHFRLSAMLAKESVAQRMEAGISFTEFSYQILQAYDFYHLFKEEGVTLQLGGSDQWGNITAGIDLIRRLEARGAEPQADQAEGAPPVHGLTFPLVTRRDGSKFGKTAEGENIYLDPAKTSPYRFYQFWFNLADEDVPRMLRTFSLKQLAEVEELIRESEANPGKRIGQQALAVELTGRIHGEEQPGRIQQASHALFGKSTPAELAGLEAELLEAMAADIPTVELPHSELAEGLPILELSLRTGLLSSKSEGRRLLKDGGLRLNKAPVRAESQPVTTADVLHGRYLLLQSGKKNFLLVRLS